MTVFTIPQGAAAREILVEVCDDRIRRAKVRHIAGDASAWTWCGVEWANVYKHPEADLVRVENLPGAARICPTCVDRILDVYGVQDLALRAVS